MGLLYCRVDPLTIRNLRKLGAPAHRRSQDFVWGCTFSPKSRRPFFGRRPLKDRLNIPPDLSHQAKTVLKILTLALAGGALSHFSCKLGLKKIFLPPWGCRCTHCTPWLRLCTSDITIHFFRIGWSTDEACWISEQSMHLAWMHSRTAYLGLAITGWASSWTKSAKP